MGAFKNITGQQFGRLTVVTEHDRRINGCVAWDCSCSCGNNCVVRSTCLIRGVTTSCGCYQKEQASKSNKTHGKKSSSEYGRWQQAKNRCFSKSNPTYRWYGARGITMCDEWRYSFEAFLRDMGPCPEGLTLDRIDNDGPYNKENCRWASRTTQARNTRDATYVEYQGEKLHLKDLAERLGIAYKTLHARVRHNRPLLAPLNYYHRRSA